MRSVRQYAHAVAMRLPPQLLQRAKRGVRYPRYYTGLLAARRGFRRYGDRYSQRYVFVAGLPKSGTSWVESMLGAYPGYSLIAYPEIAVFDYARGGTHDFELPADFFSRLGDALCVIKIHCHGSRNNRDVLARNQVPYAILYRDLRDAAVSHVFYVKRTPWHPEYPVYRRLNVKMALMHFSRTLLPEWRDWINSWKRWRDPSRSLELRYEDILADTQEAMRHLAALYQLPPEPADAIVDAMRFSRMKTQGSFFRKGIVGDWVDHFDDDVRGAFKDVVGDALVAWGYERDTCW